MARSYGRLWPHLVSWENVLAAYRAARRGKRYRRDVAEFERGRGSNLRRLQRELASGAWRPAEYRHFLVHRPKTRRISAAPFRDRVVHHAVVRVIQPLFERRFVHESYACRVGKGTHRALRRAERFMRSRPWVLQCDVQKFFPSVDHEVLLRVVGRTVRDRRVLDLLERILRSGRGVLEDQAPSPYFPGDDLFAALRPRGLPIGNLTSQFLANVILDVIDHRILEEVRPRGYVRYCDDFLLFGDDRVALQDAKRFVAGALADLRLHLHPRKCFVKPTRVGIRFLGFRVLPDRTRLTTQSVRRAGRRLRWQARERRRGTGDAGSLRASVRAWQGHAGWARSGGLERLLLDRYGLSELIR